MITDEELQNIIDTHKAGKISDKLLEKVFIKLAEDIGKHQKFVLENKEQTYKEIAKFLSGKIHRFDSTKGKAFNFLTTCAMCFFRQEHQYFKNKNGGKWMRKE